MASRHSSLLERQFVFAGHVDEFAPGCVHTLDYLGESLLLVRDGATLRAFANVCRHRGAKLVSHTLAAPIQELVCPYHQWRYALDGRNTFARGCPVDEAGLVRVPLEIVEGLAFLALDGAQAAPFRDAATRLAPMLAAHRIALTKVAARWGFRTATHWQLFVDNFLECYHCRHAHPLLRRSESFVDWLEQGRYAKLAEATGNRLARAAAAGWPIAAIDANATGPIFHAVHASVLASASETLDGASLPTRLGLLPDRDGWFLYGFLGPLTHFTILPDYALFFRFLPIGETHTDVSLTWLVSPETVLDPDLLANLTGFWRQTISEDARLTENVDVNRLSRFMPPPRFAPMERETARFRAWLTHREVRDEFTAIPDNRPPAAPLENWSEDP